MPKFLLGHNIHLSFLGKYFYSLNKSTKRRNNINNIEDNSYGLDICRVYSKNFKEYGTYRFKKLAWAEPELLQFSNYFLRKSSIKSISFI